MTMGIIRINHTTNYFVAANAPFEDKRLSWGARGIMAYLLSKPDKWQVKDEHLINNGPSGKSQLKGYIKELKKYGYLRRYKGPRVAGKYTWYTDVYENPALNPDHIPEVRKSDHGEDTTTRKSDHGEDTTTRKSDHGEDTTTRKSASSTKKGDAKPPPENRSMVSPLPDLPSMVKPYDGQPSYGKSGHIVSTDLVNTDLVNTDLVNTETDPAVAAPKKFENSYSILLQISSEMDKPIKAINSLAKKLERRGETAASISDVWQSCKEFADRPSAAFMYWVKTQYNPRLNSKKDPTPPSSAAPPPPKTKHQDVDEIIAEKKRRRAARRRRQND